jgi:hypothetical protein
MTNVVTLPALGDPKAPQSNVGPDASRRYTICWKRLIGAYVAEIVIASTAFVGSVLLAKKYAHAQSSEDFYLMLLAPARLRRHRTLPRSTRAIDPGASFESNKACRATGGDLRGRHNHEIDFAARRNDVPAPSDDGS